MKTDIDKISDLAKLGLCGEDKKQLEKEISEIIGFIDKFGKGDPEND